MTSAEFLAACSAFARRHPAAVIEMDAPELAVDPRAASRHLRSTIQLARQRMHTTAKLALRPAASRLPTLFDQTAREHA